MKIIFMGTPDFSVGTLEALVEAGHDVCLTVTQPDKPKGRGKEMQFTPVKEAALRLGIPVYQPKRVREAECVEELRKYQADVMVVVGIWTDPAGRDPWDDAVRLYQCPCVAASEVPRSRADPVVDHQRGTSDRSDDDADGRRTGHRRYAFENGSGDHSGGDRREPP